MPGRAEHHAGARLEVDLGAVAANWRSLCERLGGAACAAVMKADAYGLGAAKVALARAGARQFFVAHVDEAIALRPFVPAAAEVFVLNGLPAGAERDCAALGIIPVLNSLSQIAAGAKLGPSSAESCRASCRWAAACRAEDELDCPAMEPARLDGITLRLVMSHLACAERQDNPTNRSQLARFEAARRALPAAPASLANLSGEPPRVCRRLFWLKSYAARAGSSSWA